MWVIWIDADVRRKDYLESIHWTEGWARVLQHRATCSPAFSECGCSHTQVFICQCRIVHRADGYSLRSALNSFLIKLFKSIWHNCHRSEGSSSLEVTKYLFIWMNAFHRPSKFLKNVITSSKVHAMSSKNDKHNFTSYSTLLLRQSFNLSNFHPYGSNVHILYHF